MADNTNIEWTDATWNPIRGCTRVSEGCLNCYAERTAARFSKPGQPYEGLAVLSASGAGWTGKARFIPQHLEDPLRWRRGRRIFVNSMSDLFHKDVPEFYIQSVFETMRQADWHRFQVLTKRADRLKELSPKLPWPRHVWMGVSVENNAYTSRIDYLRSTPAKIKFLSLEPLLGPLANLNLEGIDWVIVGGESGPGARTMQKEWVVDIRDQCVRDGVPFFFKQWGGTNKKKAGRVLENRVWNEMPTLAVA